MNKQKEKQIYAWIIGLFIMIGLPALGFAFGGWKWGLFWFVIPQLLLMLAKFSSLSNKG